MVSLEKAAGMGSIDDTAQCSTVTATSKNRMHCKTPTKKPIKLSICRNTGSRSTGRMTKR